MNEKILPEFQKFVESGGAYHDKATFIESVMADFEAKTDSLQNSMDEIANSVNTISHAIEEGVSGVVSAADRFLYPIWIKFPRRWMRTLRLQRD